LLVEPPGEFDFALNLKTVLAVGMTIPRSILTHAERVIQ
jgi:hypothetical protein